MHHFGVASQERVVMRTALLFAICLSASAVDAQPTNARVGELAQLRFAPGSSEMSIVADAQTQIVIGKIAAWAIQNPDGMIVVDGHGDRAGNERVAVRLSLRRAETVRDKLIETGVNPDQIVLAAFGSHGAKQRVVVWGTRAGMDAIVARTFRTGYAVVWNGLVTEADRRPHPAVTAARERKTP